MRLPGTVTLPLTMVGQVSLKVTWFERGKDGVDKRGGVWFAIVEYPRDARTGQRIRKRTEGFRTRRDAEAERDRVRNEVRAHVQFPIEVSGS